MGEGLFSRSQLRIKRVSKRKRGISSNSFVEIQFIASSITWQGNLLSSIVTGYPTFPAEPMQFVVLLFSKGWKAWRSVRETLEIQ